MTEHGTVYTWDYYCDKPIMWNKKVDVYEKTSRGYLQLGEWFGDINQDRLIHLLKTTNEEPNMVIEIWSENDTLDHIITIGQAFTRHLGFLR